MKPPNQFKAVADFLALVDINDVIPGIGEDGVAIAPSPCPVCEESRSIRVVTSQTYECTSCGYEGTAAQYLIEREGYKENEALIYEISRRCGIPPPFEPEA
jgi:Zn ribbon nucleic-acid-binding protein